MKDYDAEYRMKVAKTILAQLGGNEDDATEKFYSGMFMIKTLRHTFDQSPSTHVCDMEMVKDGFADAI